MISRRDAALSLDIPLEMAQRHGIPLRLTETELADIEANPPAWLVQSRANRTGKRPIWTQLRCYICDYSEAARPKKWWPAFDYVICAQHNPDELPSPAAGCSRREYEGIGTRFVGITEQPARPPQG
ncbi:hypothetical protein IV498_04610 [Paenarthrobacter sp. Z7-10]|uniref:hypothetical protein n=1 Tax=Paenarthrobacter sp. Z7-10 TaxID=2787635 RepID=UPI0022A9782C|nr:hypothetical protein [Paenarthrobacter sp. Z7-10]MCZ2402479.1 hypothetical protein [Paenarthrobacter sp. Z7-10]